MLELVFVIYFETLINLGTGFAGMLKFTSLKENIYPILTNNQSCQITIN